MPMIVPGSWGPEKILGFRCNNVKILEKGRRCARHKDDHLDHTNIVISAYGEKR